MSISKKNFLVNLKRLKNQDSSSDWISYLVEDPLDTKYLFYGWNSSPLPLHQLTLVLEMFHYM
jgi:hypothetical protein